MKLLKLLKLLDNFVCLRQKQSKTSGKSKAIANSTSQCLIKPTQGFYSVFYIRCERGAATSIGRLWRPRTILQRRTLMSDDY